MDVNMERGNIKRDTCEILENYFGIFKGDLQCRRKEGNIVPFIFPSRQIREKQAEVMSQFECKAKVISILKEIELEPEMQNVTAMSLNQ